MAGLHLGMSQSAFTNKIMIGHRVYEANKVSKKAVEVWERQTYQEADDRIRGQYRKTQCFCSCWMCGHRRKHEGLTIQERKLELTAGDG